MENTCQGVELIIFLSMFKKILTLIQMITPILAIIAITVICCKMMANPEEKKYKKKLINTVIALIVVFLIPTITKVAINLAASSAQVTNCLEDEELSSLMEQSYQEAEYIEIDDKDKKNIYTNPNDYENGEPSSSESKPTIENNPTTTSMDNAIYFLNVGASTDAIIIQDSGKFALIDTSYTNRASFILKQLKKLGATSLEFIMITHSHVDHTGGYDKIMDAIPVKALFIKKAGTSRPAHEGTYKRIIKKAEKKNTFICDVATTKCQNFSVGNIKFKIYNTEFISASSNLSSKNRGRIDNANSIATVATINNRRIYFAGDIGNYFGNNQESKAARQIGDVDVYKAAHHGFTSFNNHQTALNNLKTEYAVITNTKTKAKTAVQRMKRANKNFVKAYYTPEGTVTLHISQTGEINFSQ